MYCPGCHKTLDTSLTSCDRCGWQIALGQCIPRAEHDRIVADYLAVIDHMRHEHDYWRGRAEFAEAQFEALAEMAPPPQSAGGTMDDLVKRLRDIGDHAAFEPHMHHVAADAIEALQALVRELEHDRIEMRESPGA